MRQIAIRVKVISDRMFAALGKECGTYMAASWIEPKFLKEYYEKQASSMRIDRLYLEGSAWSLHYHVRRLREILRYLALVPGGIFLDVGCAEGLYVGEFRRLHPNSVCVGVDISCGYLRKARSMIPDVDWVLADAQNLPFRNKSFDFVLCSEVMEHLPNARKCLEELARTSKRRFLISFPLVSPYRRLATVLKLFRELEDPFYGLSSGHITELSLRDIENWCHQISCVVEEAKALCFLVPEKIAMKLRIPDSVCSIVSRMDSIVSRLVNGRICTTPPTPDCTVVAVVRRLQS